ncbi:hypothetical protein A2733_01105 [Candidatus Nomurabacteria bacterium RIFCSPHIGHO2_01_FULL_40_20]|uniref:Uncharacterized protein n=1 Tax=Candidatus Nomurabacteria bacterium RIFCSPHIGHO2_01_FULL_40_20 TaxID=1801738 RepID=A0A1F6V362_9BACT|nr:MAG: hypothetical protein A2733_01105 [Candidatus Nomurabacteria bacterium RIFCSPHIGHO2_01_FULL_40_20]
MLKIWSINQQLWCVRIVKLRSLSNPTIFHSMKKSRFLRRLGVLSADNFVGMLGEMREHFIEETAIYAKKALLLFIPLISLIKYIATFAGGEMIGIGRLTAEILIFQDLSLNNLPSFNMMCHEWRF